MKEDKKEPIDEFGHGPNIELISYLKKKVEGFEITDINKELVGKLKLNEKGQVQLGGAIVFPLFGLLISFSMNSYALATDFNLYSALGISIILFLALLQVFMFVVVMKKKKIVKILFIIYYLLSIILNLFAIASVIMGFIWIIYFSISKRVKYTFVE